MKELFLVNVEKDMHLRMSDIDGLMYTINIDNDLKQAITSAKVDKLVQNKNSHSAISNTQEASSYTTNKVSNKAHELTPRDIQSRVRSGMTAEDISQHFTIPLEKVQRYSEQVEREKDIVIEQFQHLHARQEKKGDKLIDVVNEFFDENDIDRNTATWMTTRIGREPWEIRLYFKHNSAACRAIWTWDPKQQIISEINETAQTITQYFKDIVERTATESSSTRDKKLASTISDSENDNELKNLSGGYRLRQQFNSITKGRTELDNAFNNVANTKPKLELLQNEIVQNDNMSQVLSPKLNEQSNKQSESQISKFPISSTSVNISNLTEKQMESNNEKLKIDTQTDNADTNNVHNLNITRKIRTKINQRKANKRKSVPSWDEIMLSSPTELKQGEGEL